MKKWFNHFFDLIYPRTCEGCKTTLLGEEKLICLKCLITLPKTNSHREETTEITKKFWGKLKVEAAYSFLKFTKKGKVQNLLHELKYRNKPELGIKLGELYGQDLKEINIDKKVDLLIGIPLHPSKLKIRGYNQADCIAEGLSNTLNIPFDNQCVRRTKNTETQTKKTRIERYRNMESVFEVVDKEKILNKRIAIIDDVLTTGSTIESLGNTLLEEGCKEIYVITIASVA